MDLSGSRLGWFNRPKGFGRSKNLLVEKKRVFGSQEMNE